MTNAAPPDPPAAALPDEPLTVMQIAMTDFRVSQYFGGVLLFAVFGLFLLLFSPVAQAGGVAIVCALAFALVLWWRLNRFATLLEHCAETTGTIEHLRRSLFARRYRYRYTVRYAYAYAGQSYEGTCTVYRTPQTFHAQEGDIVRVFVHRAHPQRSLPPDIFIE